MRLFVFFLLLCSLHAHAQSVNGVVKDGRTGKPLYPVTVVNVRTQQGSSTDEKGNYTVAARTGDVIAFTYVGYKNKQLTCPDAILVATLNVELEPTEYQLEEFRLRPGHLTQYQMDSAERASIYKFPLLREHSSPVTSPVSAIAELFNKNSRRIFEFQKNFHAGETEKFIDTKYNPEIVEKLTGATGDSIGHFMYAYPMPYNFARLASDLEIKMWIRDSYRKWLKDGAKDTMPAVGK